MKNPKTTLAGYLVLVSVIAKAIVDYMNGGLTAIDFGAVQAALAAVGIGLIASKDGGH